MASTQSYEREKWIFIILAFMSVMAVAASVLFLTAITGGALNRSRSISNTGTVKGIGVGVFWDGSCTNQVSSIDWGFVEPGSSYNKPVYIRNEGTATVTLTLNTTNWNPSNASNYITLSWNYTSQAVAPKAVIPVTFTLTVAANTTGIEAFSFDIIVTGTEQA
jgi:hypothetical protein